MKKLIGRASLTVYIAVIIVICFSLIIPGRTVQVTLGTLANKQTDLTGCRVIIVNCITGKRVGRFVYFDTTDDSRRCVVFALAATEVEPTVTTFRGYVVGVFDERIPGCDHDPPFLYVMDCRPVP
jgi:hypothetical protein